MSSPLPRLLFCSPRKCPNHALFTLNRHPHHRLLSSTPQHPFLSTPATRSEPPFGTGPSPPRLPKQEQDLFETLQRQSTGAFSTPRTSSQPPPPINQSPNATASEIASAETLISNRTDKLLASQQQQQQIPSAQAGQTDGNRDSNTDTDADADATNVQLQRAIEARGTGAELHPHVRRGAKAEFEGDVNPKTGEVGGPKNEPLRWGSAGEWSYNGRTTDF